MSAARTLLPLLAFLGCAASSPESEAWCARDHVRPGQVVIQGHRGVISLVTDHPGVALREVNAYLARP
ncbi:MAG: hypothetical protein RL479_1403 [Verrucomicrobiota bacterium]